MSNITTIGKFDLEIQTGCNYSYIYYEGEVVASAKPDQMFSVSAGIQSVPVDLLAGFADVFNQANDLLTDAREIVVHEHIQEGAQVREAGLSKTVPSYCVVKDRHRNKPTVGFWTYDPTIDRSSYSYISSETGCWVNGNWHTGKVSTSESDVLSDWSVDKPDLDRWKRRRQVMLNQSFLDGMLQDKPLIAYLGDSDNSVFAFLRNRDGQTYSAYYLVKFDDTHALVFPWTITEISNLTQLKHEQISPEQAAQCIPAIKWLKAYRKDSSRKYHFFVRKFFDNSVSNIEVLRDGSILQSSIHPDNLTEELSDIDWSKKDCPIWSRNDGAIQVLVRERSEQYEQYLSNQSYKVVVPKVHINNGLYQFNPLRVAFAERINGVWRSYDGTTGHHAVFHTDLMTHPAWVEVKELPKPIGYRAFNVKRGQWADQDGFALWSTNKDNKSIEGFELRPWYGPSLIK